MNILHHIYQFVYGNLGQSLFYILGFLTLFGVVAQWRLYEKAGQPGLASIIPVWNLIVFLKIVGRPANHLWLFLIPFYGQFYLLPKVWIELCQSFGKRTMLDYVLVVLLNGLYIFNLGLSEAEYEGPAYGKVQPAPNTRPNHRPSLA
ncbi:MAG TPA: DUF5684 domain-containing protein [Flavobacteriales bacterium]|nr:DUF5684 domain-containing protein [Flavobacteriales bacterium]HRP81812.1 DUF5684 domain-containing protein [Flavobacteriales bacterium]HRQ84646.1 DUF5684 domain-containing protein [Flavobacteriales bacterium]